MNKGAPAHPFACVPLPARVFAGPPGRPYSRAMASSGDRAVQRPHRPAFAGTIPSAMGAAILVAMVLNNIDGQMLALIKPLLDVEFGWSNLVYGRVAAASQLAAALCLPLMGWIADMSRPGAASSGALGCEVCSPQRRHSPSARIRCR